MRIPFLLLILTFSASCSELNNKSEEADKNIQLVEQYFQHFNNHEWQKMANMYSEVAEFKDPSLGPGIVKMTRAETANKYAELNQTFPDIHDRIVQIYPSGENNIIVEFVSTGTAPDGANFELPICTIFTIENAKITMDFTYFDNSN